MVSLSHAFRKALPQGGFLPADHWNSRHRWILALLWAHVAFIFSFALLRGFSMLHAALETSVIGVLAAVATHKGFARRVRVLTGSLGLLSSSAILVHLSGGYIEMHFHFFVMVAVVALYQDWIPFLASIGYVLIHHGVVGALDPRSVYNHADAIANPWTWAGIHAFFIAGISIACLVTWRLNELILEQRFRAEEKLKEEQETVQTLNDVGKNLAAELDLNTLIQKVTDAGTSLTSAQYGAFFYNVADEEGEAYLLHSLAGADAGAFSDFSPPRVTELFAPTFGGEGVVRLDDVTQDPRFGKNDPYFGLPKGHLPVRSYLAVPVVSRTGTIHGGLFFSHDEAGRFSAMDEKLAIGIAAHAAIAIDNAQLYESEIKTRHSLEKAKRQLELMAEASRVFFSSLDLETILRGLMTVALPDAGDAGLTFVLGEGGEIEGPLVWKRDVHSPPELIQGEVGLDLIDEDLNPFVSNAGSTEITFPADPSILGRMFPIPSLVQRLEEIGSASMNVFPISRRARNLGFLVLFSSTDRRLDGSDLGLGVEMTRRAAIAIENAQLYARQRSVAETLQHSLLLEAIPNVPGVTAAAKYLPAGPGTEVGGDWYDFFQLENGRLAIAMGDVAGRGVPAASLMGQLRNALRAYGLEGWDPSSVMERLNRALLQIDNGHMATLFYGVLDLESSMLTYANAGHPPPLVVDGDRVTIFESAGGIPLGTLPSAKYPQQTVELAAGSALIAYTDGLVEDTNTPFDVGLNTLERALEDFGSLPVEDLCSRVLGRVLANRARGDDVAILALRVLPVDSRISLTIPANPSSLRALRAYLRKWLNEFDVPQTTAYDILTAAGEAFSNAIIHSGVKTSEFQVEGEVGDRISITVSDSGHWTEPNASSSNGRGLEIIKELMHDFEVIRTPAGTMVRMQRDLDRVKN